MFSFVRPALRLQNQKKPAILRSIETMEPSNIALIPLSLVRGRQLICNVRPGKALPKFTTLAYPSDDTYDDCGVLMPVSGRVLEIKEIDHALLGRVKAAVVEYDKDIKPRATVSYELEHLTQDELLSLAKMSCIVDSLDGVCLYTKLKEFTHRKFDVLVVDCIEDQPYSSALIRQLLERGEQIARGAAFVLRAMGKRRAEVKIVCNERVKGKIKKEYKGIPVVTIKGGYPLRDKLAAKFKKKGYVSIGGAALADFCHFLSFGQGQTSCVVTVAGDCVKNPVNLQVPIGTPVYAVLRHCGLCAEPEVVVLGDVLTGVALSDLMTPITPHVRTVMAMSFKEAKGANCIGCGRCLRVCHKGLMPYAIFNGIERDDKRDVVGLRTHDCDLCGACSFVCPSKIELTKSFAMIKDLI